MSVSRQLTNDDTHWLPYEGKKYYRSQWVSSNVWLPTFFKISFVFNKNSKQVWNNIFLGELSF